MKSLAIGAMLGLMLWGMSGCTVLDGQGEMQGGSSDARVAELAMRGLYQDSMTASATLQVTVENGLATLYGVVPNEVTRQRALQILSGTEGVYDVLDRTRRR